MCKNALHTKVLNASEGQRSSFFLIICSEKKICVGICYNSIRSRCSLRSYLLQRGKKYFCISIFSCIKHHFFSSFNLSHVYNMQIHVQAVISILLSTFAGFGLAMSGASIVAEFLRWRERRRSVSQSIPSRAPSPPSLATPSYSSPRHRGDGNENPSTLSRSQ